MKRFVILVVALLQLALVAEARTCYNIKDFGAKGNGKSVNTEAINRAIKHCSEQGGGVVVVPKGVFVSGTIFLQNNVELRLEEGAVLAGVEDPTQYTGYVCPDNRYDHFKVAQAAYWNHCFILAQGCHNVAITGEGTIDGRHIYDPNGEAHFRGPHALMFAETDGLTLRGVNITRASNYAVMGYALKNTLIENVKITEGCDAVHIRGSKNMTIRDCSFETGDDCIAGGYWENTLITRCYINSTCNGLRIIFPVTNCEISHCRIEGPGHYVQRHIAKLTGKMLAAVIVQPGAWWPATGGVDNLYLHDLDIADLRCAFAANLRMHTWSKSITLERIRAKNIYHSAIQIDSWRGGIYDNVTLRDVEVEYAGRTDEKARTVVLEAPKREARLLPYWAFYARNVRNLTLDGVKFTYTGQECRSAIGFENISYINMNNVDAQAVEGKETIHAEECQLVPETQTKNYVPGVPKLYNPPATYQR